MTVPDMESAEAEEAVSSYAQWLMNRLSEHRAREEVLSKEITAVREAAAVGATALVELRGAVQEQLDTVARQLNRLAQDLENTKVELAEVVIEKEEHEGELMREVESLRKLLETQKGLQHTQETQLNALEKKRQEATEREVALKQQLETKVQGTEERISQTENVQSHLTQRLEECVVESQMMKLFEKFDISMQKQLEQLRESQVSLQSQLQSQHRGAQSKEEGIRRIVEECDRKLLELSSQITMVEESHRHDVEQIRSDIQGLERQEKEAALTPNQGSMKIPPPSDTESLHASASRTIVKADPQTPASISIPVGAPLGACHGHPTPPVTSAPPVVSANITGLGTPVAASPVPPITMTMGTPQNAIVAPATFTTDSWRFSPAPQPVWAVSGTGVRRVSVLGTPTTHG